jgi:hypothetical protein
MGATDLESSTWPCLWIEDTVGAARQLGIVGDFASRRIQRKVAKAQEREGRIGSIRSALLSFPLCLCALAPLR